MEVRAAKQSNDIKKGSLSILGKGSSFLPSCKWDIGMMVLIFLQDVPLPNSNGLFGAGVKAGKAVRTGFPHMNRIHRQG